MEEIEERAWNSAVRRMQGDSSYALGYKDGATEQLHLDEQFYTSEMMQKERELRQTIERAKGYLRTLFAPSEMTELMCEKMEQYIRNIPPK